MKIAILGGGNWGSALGIHLSTKSDIVIWDVDEKNVESINTQNLSIYLPEVSLPINVTATSKLSEAVDNTTAIILVVPSKFAETTIKQLEELKIKAPLIIATKGFAPNQELISDIAEKYLDVGVYTLFGPNIAIEVAQGKLSGAVLGGKSGKERNRIQELIEGDRYKLETCEDMIGLQVGAALKNIVTILVGIVESSSSAENTKAYVFVKGLREIIEIGEALGGQKESMLGLNGLGDLLLRSRNRELGIRIGNGEKLNEILTDQKHVPEGVVAIENAIKIADRFNLRVPLIRALYDILFKDTHIEDIIDKF